MIHYVFALLHFPGVRLVLPGANRISYLSQLGPPWHLVPHQELLG